MSSLCLSSDRVQNVLDQRISNAEEILSVARESAIGWKTLSVVSPKYKDAESRPWGTLSVASTRFKGTLMHASRRLI